MLGLMLSLNNESRATHAHCISRYARTRAEETSRALVISHPELFTPEKT